MTWLETELHGNPCPEIRALRKGRRRQGDKYSSGTAEGSPSVADDGGASTTLPLWAMTSAESVFQAC